MVSWSATSSWLEAEGPGAEDGGWGIGAGARAAELPGAGRGVEGEAAAVVGERGLVGVEEAVLKAAKRARGMEEGAKQRVALYKVGGSL